MAIREGTVVDHDRDFEALARRVFDRFGPRPLYMPRMDAEERTVRVPSPRVGPR